MVNFRSITDKAKELLEKRGGTESLKEDAGELKDIATGEGSIKDKAQAAVEAVKDPGAEGPGEGAGSEGGGREGAGGEGAGRQGDGAGRDRPQGEGRREGGGAA
jgi:hypothetical protein